MNGRDVESPPAPGPPHLRCKQAPTQWQPETECVELHLSFLENIRRFVYRSHHRPRCFLIHCSSGGLAFLKSATGFSICANPRMIDSHQILRHESSSLDSCDSFSATQERQVTVFSI